MHVQVHQNIVDFLISPVIAHSIVLRMVFVRTVFCLTFAGLYTYIIRARYKFTFIPLRVKNEISSINYNS